MDEHQIDERILDIAMIVAEKLVELNEKRFSIIPTMTLNQVADALGISCDTMRKLCETGEIPYVKVGKFYRIKPGDVNKYLDRRYYQGVPGKPLGIGSSFKKE